MEIIYMQNSGRIRSVDPFLLCCTGIQPPDFDSQLQWVRRTHHPFWTHHPSAFEKPLRSNTNLVQSLAGLTQWSKFLLHNNNEVFSHRMMACFSHKDACEVLSLYHLGCVHGLVEDPWNRDSKSNFDMIHAPSYMISILVWYSTWLFFVLW
jgi:hypothetical protein